MRRKRGAADSGLWSGRPNRGRHCELGVEEVSYPARSETQGPGLPFRPRSPHDLTLHLALDFFFDPNFLLHVTLMAARLREGLF